MRASEFITEAGFLDRLKSGVQSSIRKVQQARIDRKIDQRYEQRAGKILQYWMAWTKKLGIDPKLPVTKDKLDPFFKYQFGTTPEEVGVTIPPSTNPDQIKDLIKQVDLANWRKRTIPNTAPPPPPVPQRKPSSSVSIEYNEPEYLVLGYRGKNYALDTTGGVAGRWVDIDSGSVVPPTSSLARFLDAQDDIIRPRTIP